MNDIDERIRKALEIDRDLLKKAQSIDEPGFFEMMIQCYRGKNSWLNLMVIGDIILFLGMATWSLYEYFHTDSLESKLGWSLLLMVSLMVVALGKLWAWMQINKNTMMREIKRVELLLLRMHETLRSKG